MRCTCKSYGTNYCPCKKNIYLYFIFLCNAKYQRKFSMSKLIIKIIHYIKFTFVHNFVILNVNIEFFVDSFVS